LEKTGVIFLNPRSGTSDANRASDIRAAASERGLEVVDIRQGIDIPSLVRQRLADGQRLFLAAGGDGTIHSVVQSLVGSEGRLAIIPAGTVNHLAKDLNIPLDWREALDLAFKGEAKMIDVGKVNDTYFTNVILLGLYPDMVRERERLRHWYGKTRAYLRAIYKSMVRFHHVTIVIEAAQKAEVIRTAVFGVSVNKYDFDSPGIIAPKETFEGGQLAVYWLPEGGRLAVLRTIIKFVSGKLALGRDVRTLYTRELRVQARQPRLRLGMNGELVTADMPLRIKVVPGALHVVVPPQSDTEETNPG
jgi:diacylglycerol kinase family enzyme